MKVRLVLVLMLVGMLAACSQNDSTVPTSTAATTSALDRSGPGPERMMERLGLTEEQRAKVQAVFESHRQEREAIRQACGEGASQTDLEAKHEALRARIHEELKNVLTAAQMQQLEEWHKNRPRPGRGGMNDEERSAHMDRRMERLTAELGLSTEQQAKIRALWETRHAGFAARNPGERPGAQERQTRHQAFLEELKQILNAEQLAKFQELHPGGQGGRARRGQTEG